MAAGVSQAKDAGLEIKAGDLRIQARDDGGFDLYVRKKPGIDSVLLTESTKDPAMKADNFAYRAAEYNEVNGDETRLLDGKPLPASSKLYSLISSTPLPDPSFGQAFRILIPPVIVYGYPWSRSGTISVGKGSYLNIRAFEKPYADYSGAFRDNPYQISISARPLPPPSPPPAPAQVQEPKKEIPPPPADDRTSSKIARVIEPYGGESLDLVVCLDTTESMTPYIDDIKKNLTPMIRERTALFKTFRVGIVLYKDYWPDDYITRKYPFSSDLAAFESKLKGISVYGGKDVPEALHEALYAAATEFDWKAERRLVIFVTDAPPHPEPRGKILFSSVAKAAAEERIEIDPVIEPEAIKPPKPAKSELDGVAAALAPLASKRGSGGAARVLAFAEGLPKGAPEGSSGATDAIAPALACLPGVELIGTRAIDPPSDVSAADSGELRAARAANASYVVIRRAESYGSASSNGHAGAIGETVTRLLDAATGKELARDVSWRAVSASGAEALFVDGVRQK